MESRSLPEVGEGEVLVRVLAAGICAGDAKCYVGASRLGLRTLCENFFGNY